MIEAMPRDPDPAADLRALGLDPKNVAGIELVHEAHGNRLYRVTDGVRAYVLKQLGAPGADPEPRAYGVLRSLAVPTLPLYGSIEGAILLEDLRASAEWRLATEEDVERPEVAAAVAEWYRALHDTDLGADAPAFLSRESDTLGPQVIHEMASRLGLDHLPAFRLAAESIERLKTAIRSLPQVLNYNDFHWSNLALSLEESPVRAVVFDYGLLGMGLRYSDCRNVVSSLGDRAGDAFWKAYGPFSEEEKTLDEAVADLYSLSQAARRNRLPGWARSSMRKAETGELEESILRALAIL